VFSSSTTAASVARVLAALVLALAIVVAVPSPTPSAARSKMELAVSDNPVFLYRAFYNRKKAFKQAKEIGTSRIRVLLPWHSALRPKQARKHKQPKHLHYTLRKWDDLIDAAARKGMRVDLIIAGKAPAFATDNHRLGKHAPNAKKFGKFVKSMAKHFKGRVDRYSIWNEPNYVAWLRPLKKAPTIYRKLYLAAYKSIKKVDKKAKVLVGETSPHDSGSRSTSPISFLRKFACVDRYYHRVGHCPTIHADGYAQHPYEFKYAPTEDHADADDVSIGTLSHLTNALDRLRSSKALVAPHNNHMSVYLTEFGYFARGRRKMSEKQAARYLPEAYSVALHNSRVREMTQYGLINLPKRYPSGYFDLGLIRLNGKPRKSFKSLRKWAKHEIKAHRVKAPSKHRIKLHKARKSADSR
jgi:hypothetical protein